MCYSARFEHDYRKYQREYGSDVRLAEFAKLVRGTSRWRQDEAAQGGRRRLRRRDRPRHLRGYRHLEAEPIAHGNEVKHQSQCMRLNLSRIESRGHRFP